ncbi:Germin-like protein subfamily 1 member 18 [Hibiscus syriacus]|uniref:RING-type E3 ubiquitin transferase n=1 Tax=Hibiscus syriacus TaxID=106335 RepID=A0A6A2WR22_HIBSY|nr:U-box domain-containing protein 9-like [Hibiscus syriacus]KAE8663058.1 Germin-like protein subfamily 1 member 18 [Hibiscus syriacus]
MAEKKESAAAIGGGKEAELKKELESVMKMILEEVDYGIEKIIEAIRILTRLTESKLKKPAGLGLELDDTVLTDAFTCPLSGQIMADPVVLASGQTYDRPYIESWVNQGNLTCPRSKQVLSYSILTPNCLVRELITRWCGVRGVPVPESHQDINGDEIEETDLNYLYSLLGKMSSSSRSDQKEAAKELMRLTKANPSNRTVFCQIPNAFSTLLRPLSESKVELHPDLQEDLIKTVLNLSTDDNNKEDMGENPIVIPLLIESMKYGTTETIITATAVLSTLSQLDSNKLIIGKSRAHVTLLELLHRGHPLAMREAASTIFNLCKVYENKTRFIEIGAVQVILHIINGPMLVDELLGILALLSTHPNAIGQLREAHTVHYLFQIMRGSYSKRTKEKCVVILFSVCSKNEASLRELWTEETTNRTLAELADTGTERAKRKATDLILEMRRSLPVLRITST